MQADSFWLKREHGDAVNVNIAFCGYSQEGIWSLQGTQSTALLLLILHKHSTVKQSLALKFKVTFMLNDYLHEIQYCTHLFLKETMSHNNAVKSITSSLELRKLR